MRSKEMNQDTAPQESYSLCEVKFATNRPYVETVRPHYEWFVKDQRWLLLVVFVCALVGCKGQHESGTKTMATASETDKHRVSAVQNAEKVNSRTEDNKPAIWCDRIAGKIVQDSDNTHPTETYVLRWKHGVLSGHVLLSATPSSEPESIELSDVAADPSVKSQLQRATGDSPEIKVDGYLVVRTYQLPDTPENPPTRKVVMQGRTIWEYSGNNSSMGIEPELVSREGYTAWPEGMCFMTLMAVTESTTSKEVEIKKWRVMPNTKPEEIPPPQVFLSLELKAIEN